MGLFSCTVVFDLNDWNGGKAVIRLRNVVLKLLFLRVVGILFQQLFPGFDCAFGIALALPPNYAQVEQRSRMIGLTLQRFLEFGDGSIGISRVPERSA